MMVTRPEKTLTSSQYDIIVKRSKGSTTGFDSGDNCGDDIIAAEGGDIVISEDNARGLHGRRVHFAKNRSSLLSEK
jgi:hypothetical protein